MCELMARAIHAAVQRRFASRWTTMATDLFPDETLVRFYQPLDPYLNRDAGQDCALFENRAATTPGVRRRRNGLRQAE